MKQDLLIREATRTDAHLLVTMIRELADFEHRLDRVDITTDDLVRDGLGSDSRFHALVAEWDGHPAGYAFYFFTYSTWIGRHGLFVEDLYVRDQFRSKGIGKALLKHMATIAHKQSCYGMRWEVLDWNTPAIDFYRSLGAELERERLQVFFTGDRFKQFAREDDER
jgi:GNAT superfamily N-acetyltransferase